MAEHVGLKETVEAGPYLFTFDGDHIEIRDQRDVELGLVMEPEHRGEAYLLSMALRRASARMEAVGKQMEPRGSNNR
jgi:hypothetical protein